MARSSDINQRIVLTGADEVLRHLQDIAEAGQRAGNTTRAALLAATGSTAGFTSRVQESTKASRQLQFALTQVGFQVNDIATSLASGISPMQVFAQQAGQIFQAFQQGGGFRAVIGGITNAVTSMITPMRVATVAALGLGAAIVALVARGMDTQTSIKQFDVQLKGLANTTRTTGAELEAQARRLRDIGIGISDARQLIQQLNVAPDVRAGRVTPEQIIRTATDLQRVLPGTFESFIAASIKGGDALRTFAQQLNLIPSGAQNVSKELAAAEQSLLQFNRSVQDVRNQQAKSIVDEARTRERAFQDLETQRRRALQDFSRERGTQEEELKLQQKRQIEDIETASARRLEDINRESADNINEIIRKRNEENTKALAEFNQKILGDAQQALDSDFQSIANRVRGLDKQAISPAEQATRDLAVAWQDLNTQMETTSGIQTSLTEFTNLLGLFTNINAQLERMAKNRAAFFSAGGGGGVPVATADIPMAGGGLVRGPGTGTSDSVPIRASRGEFVVNALSTRMNLPILRAINAMRRPMLSARGRGFATGGMVTAGGGTPVNIHLDGGVFQLQGETGVVGALTRAARRSAMLSAGRKPSTA